MVGLTFFSSYLRNDFNLLLVTGNINFIRACPDIAGNDLDPRQIIDNLIHDEMA